MLLWIIRVQISGTEHCILIKGSSRLDLCFVNRAVCQKPVHHIQAGDARASAEAGTVDVGYRACKACAVLQRVVVRCLAVSLQIGIQEASVEYVASPRGVYNGVALLERGKRKTAVCIRTGTAANNIP